MLSNATATHSAAYNTIIASNAVTPITSKMYTTNKYNAFHKGMLSVSKSVPTTLGGGTHGHAYVILSDAGINKLTGTNTARTFTAPPNPTPNFDAANTATQITIKELAWNSAVELYHTQEGCLEGLKKLIIKNVLENTIMELEDEEFGFELVASLELMEHIKLGCKVVDSIDVKELITQRDTPLDLDGEETLKITFKNILKILKKLKKNKVETSESEMMVNLLLQLEEEEDFDDNMVN